MTNHYIYENGTYFGAYGDGAEPDPETSPAGLINLGSEPPITAAQVWQFPGWGLVPITVDNFVEAIQEKLDTSANDFGYDDIRAAVTYADEPAVAKFQTEGKAFRAWRSKCWAYCYEQLALIQGGKRAQPTIPELLAELPLLELPHD